MSNEVELHMYDLSRGLANSLSWLLVGKQLDGVWHTSIAVFGKEYYFGQEGIISSNPGHTDFGKPPDKILELGKTYRSRQDFDDHLSKLKCTEFARGNYSLWKNNCNEFSNELSKFLVGREIPQDILRLPDDIWKGGTERLGQAATIGSAAYSAYQVKQMFESKNKEAKKEENASAGPSWLAVGGAIAAMATAGAAFASFMNEEETPRNRNAVGWRYDSDSD